MASLEQKSALVDKYCNAHREWVQNAEMHQRNYESAMSDYASANQRIDNISFQLEILFDHIEKAEKEMRDIEREMMSSDDTSPSRNQYLFRLESLRNYIISTNRQIEIEKENLRDAQEEAARAYATAQHERGLADQAQANADQCQHALEQMREQLIQEAEVLQTQVNSESSYASTLQGASGNMFANSALTAAGRLQTSANAKQTELDGTRSLIDRINQEIEGNSSDSSMGTRVLRRR